MPVADRHRDPRWCGSGEPGAGAADAVDQVVVVGPEIVHDEALEIACNCVANASLAAFTVGAAAARVLLPLIELSWSP